MSRRHIRLFIAAAALAVAGPAEARVEFAAYEGAEAEQVGSGGTRIERNGIDWWTSGAPPRRFRVLGILTDSRRNAPLRGRAIGSSSIAERTLELGGNAVIILDQETRSSGISGSWIPLGDMGLFSARNRRNTTTTFLVVRYLEGEGANPPPPSEPGK